SLHDGEKRAQLIDVEQGIHGGLPRQAESSPVLMHQIKKNRFTYQYGFRLVPSFRNRVAFPAARWGAEDPLTPASRRRLPSRFIARSSHKSRRSPGRSAHWAPHSPAHLRAWQKSSVIAAISSFSRDSMITCSKTSGSIGAIFASRSRSRFGETWE